nr:DnaJ domain-containing protein [Tanacetum cinerariifolium]
DECEELLDCREENLFALVSEKVELRGHVWKHTKKQGRVKEKSCPSKTVYIYIDDDESPIDHHAGQNARNSEKCASSSRRYVPDISPLKLSKGKRTYSGIRFSAPSDIE